MTTKPKTEEGLYQACRAALITLEAQVRKRRLERNHPTIEQLREALTEATPEGVDPGLPERPPADWDRRTTEGD